ncbi:MAG: carbohydrate porin [Paludibacteraceae bacterium]|nr:carbohydrate porin [Paludibacteraceae bacterium]
MDGNFAASEYGSAFINSSFGIPSTFAYNIPSPIFPFTALGLRLEWSLLENLLLKTAVYDGQPDDFESHPYRLNWEISQKEGFLSISEIEWNKSLLKNRNGSYKIGLYYHQSTDSLNIKQKNNGVYLIADQEINKNTSAFAQLSVSPKNKNRHYLYAGAGINQKGIFRKNSNDLLGFGIAYAALKNFDKKGETAFELTYQYCFNEHFILQPDLQYILHPAGTEETINNTFVGFLRFYVNF